MSSQSQSAAGPQFPRPRRVLIIEDDEQSRELLRRVVEDAGHEVIAAVESVGAAMGALLDDLPPDVVLLDYMLPDANGAEFLRTVRKLPASPRVAIVSAAPNLERNAELTALRPDAIIRKPIALKEIVAFIESSPLR